MLVVKLDRLTRSVRDLAALSETAAREGWGIVSLGESIDTATAAGRLVLHVLGSVAAWEREAAGERTREALAYKARRGEYTGGAPPYGWRVAADGLTLTPDPGEQAALALANDLHCGGLSLRRIGKELAARGLLPRGGGAWHPQTVRALTRAPRAAAGVA